MAMKREMKMEMEMLQWTRHSVRYGCLIKTISLRASWRSSAKFWTSISSTACSICLRFDFGHNEKQGEHHNVMHLFVSASIYRW
jgi:hypothetical protein